MKFILAVKELPVLKHYFQAIETLRQSPLEWTIFQNGCFLDYWGHPHIKSYLRPSPFGIDIAGKVAAIPGDGDTRFTVTYSFDVAKYVVAALDLDEWPETTRIAGDIITWKEFVNLAESTTGVGSKFEVFYDPIDKLERGELTELPSQIPCYATFPKPRFQWFMAIFSRWTADEEICFIPGELNAKFPDIQPMTVKAMLETYWRA
ncbi:hypothetical protein B0J15DRAFT_579344 [Fusarium solani]|uniref:Uncharacterized protein n=1 Tax=Fusarium solani TaxID=169388 RepID=A0A9P9R7V2_FUSSL|nr:uncharacterized protein B0J15DRAFT_579344 [Fusarium solani]KAH7268884.1 hypothetical protein B0J15DRAFT_579344 [Fusarium solani]